MKKIIFLDVDGTLVDYENRLPESAVQAIRIARQNGHRVYICTGRSKAEIYQDIWEIGLDGMIGGNGSYVESDGHMVLQRLITKEQCRLIVDWLQARGLEFYLESNNGLFASRGLEEKGNAVIREYAKRKEQEGADQVTLRTIFPNMIFGSDLYRDDLNKVSFILSNYQDYLDARDAFPDLQAGTWGGMGETALFGDLGVRNINKAYAIEALLKYLNADVSDTIAFGDAKVDIPMLEYCAYGVAMGNGGAEIKEIADLITDSVEADGLWNAFAKLNLLY